MTWVSYCAFVLYLKVLAPLPIGFAVFMVHLATIPVTGTGINPARSLGAAVMYNQQKAWDDHVSSSFLYSTTCYFYTIIKFKWNNHGTFVWYVFYVCLFSGSFGLDHLLEQQLQPSTINSYWEQVLLRLLDHSGATPLFESISSSWGVSGNGKKKIIGGKKSWYCNNNNNNMELFVLWSSADRRFFQEKEAFGK